jgi:hypothetical protein
MVFNQLKKLSNLSMAINIKLKLIACNSNLNLFFKEAHNYKPVGLPFF